MNPNIPHNIGLSQREDKCLFPSLLELDTYRPWLKFLKSSILYRLIWSEAMEISVILRTIECPLPMSLCSFTLLDMGRLNVTLNNERTMGQTENIYPLEMCPIPEGVERVMKKY